jgi:peroxiredoxin
MPAILHVLCRLPLAALLFVALVSAPGAVELQPGRQAPGFRLEGIDGQRVSLDGLRGKFVVLHFAATWCPFCAAEAPHLEKLHHKYRDRGVAVAIIDVKESKRKVAKMAKKFGFTFPVLLDPAGAVASAFAPPPDVLPDLERDEVMIASNLIIDREGRIQFFSLLDSANFDAKLVKLQARLDQLLEGK